MSGSQHDDAEPLVGTTAVVTGAGRGLGRITAQALAAAGAAVGLIARSAAELEETARLIAAQGGTATVHSADVSDEEQISRAIREVRRDLGPIEVLVNNAGVNGPISAFAEVDPQEWWRTLEINLGGAVRCSRLVLPGMVARRRGRIINVTSVAGTYRWPFVSAYAVSKAALVKFTENLAAEVRRDGISVFSFHPGLLPIGLAAAGMNGNPAPPGSALARIQDWAKRQRAAGRFSEPQDSAKYIVALASGRADSLSGRHLTVDDDLHILLERLGDILRLDLHTLRLREGAAASPARVDEVAQPRSP
jgi:NAD(P)-dependent dehydrogenase (short-subunit alcohol dehydrogenase family)